MARSGAGLLGRTGTSTRASQRYVGGRLPDSVQGELDEAGPLPAEVQDFASTTDASALGGYIAQLRCTATLFASDSERARVYYEYALASHRERPDREGNGSGATRGTGFDEPGDRGRTGVVQPHDRRSWQHILTRLGFRTAARSPGGCHPLTRVDIVTTDPRATGSPPTPTPRSVVDQVARRLSNLVSGVEASDTVYPVVRDLAASMD